MEHNMNSDLLQKYTDMNFHMDCYNHFLMQYISGFDPGIT